MRTSHRTHFALALACSLALPALGEAQSWFRRGDAGGDGRVDIDDSVLLNEYLFIGGPAPACSDAADANDDGTLDTNDVVFIVNFTAAGGSAPPAPGPLGCGPDPTADSVPCATYSCPFVRGDADGNGIIDAADAVAINDFLFMAIPLASMDAADSNDDGAISVPDATLILGGGALPLPGPVVSGVDPTEDTLDSQVYAPAAVFLRGDADGDTDVDSDDNDTIIAWLFSGGPAPGCPAGTDVNADGILNTSDTLYLAAFLAGAGPAPPAPFPICGVDPLNFLPCTSGCSFIRGDADLDGQVDIDDAQAILDNLVMATPLLCRDAADANDDGNLNLQDSTFLLNYVTLGGALLPPPTPHVCGVDLTVDSLGCGAYTCFVPNDFRRGDCNTDGTLDIGDGIALLGIVFRPPAGAYVTTCRDACDGNDDGVLDIADGITLLCAALGCGPPPPAPFPDCGYDPTPIDTLGCEEYQNEGCP